MPRFDHVVVRGYYDRHTQAFVSLGEGRQSGAIHRAVWGPGVRDPNEAIHYVDNEIASVIQPLTTSDDPLHVVDLGCGVAASLIHLSGRLPIRGTGVTLSPVQARIGTERIRAAGLAGRVQCIEADFTALPASIDRADAAFAIESFVHVADPARFFEQCRDLIRPGGLLIICDDFLSGGAADERIVEQFRQGWHVNTLLTSSELHAIGDAAGFEHESTRDLSPYLRLRRPRDRAIGAFLTLLTWLHMDLDRYDDLVGGQALQTCLRRGWITYEFAVFRRR